MQCIAVIGSTRLVLLLPYTSLSIWVSTGAHILNDWICSSENLLTRFEVTDAAGTAAPWGADFFGTAGR